MSRSKVASLTSALLAVIAVAIAAVLTVPGSGASESFADAAKPVAASKERPNFVFVLTDDLSRNLLPYMKNVRQMRRQGTSFSRYTVTDSLCCPSRSSIFAGRYPHSTGVVTNKPPFGGFDVFRGRGEEADTFATTLRKQSYETAMMGKYMNGYTPKKVVDGKPLYVPPGWSDWSVAGAGYGEFNYNLVDRKNNGQPTLVHHGKRPEDYLTDVISRRGQQFMTDSVKRGNPFMLELATFAPHGPFTPAPRDASKFPNLKAPRGPLFDRAQRRPRPAWLDTEKLTPQEITKIDTSFRKRAQSVQAVDKMIGDVRTRLRQLGVAENTYIVFSSDNGFHLGQRRMTGGKQTAFDHDVRVPLVVLGPEVPRGREVDRLAANVDLRPTFEQLAGAPANPRVEGRSLAPLLRGRRVGRWRDLVLIEHRGPNRDASDPDHATPRQGNPPSYRALRGKRFAYVQYADARFAPEYYDLRRDPNERRNVYAGLPARRKVALRKRLEALHRCSGAKACHAADR